MMTFNDFVKKDNLKNEATSNIKIYQILCSIGLDNVDIYLRDGPFSTDIKSVNIRPSERTHCVCYINENYFDSYGCPPPNKPFKFITKRNGPCLYSEYKIQGLTNKRDSYCAIYCLYKFYLTKVIEIDYKSAVLNLFYQRFS